MTVFVHRRRRVLTVAATLAPVLVWAVARSAGADLTVATAGRAPMSITLPFVVATALLAALAGWGVLAILERVTTRARTLWTLAALLALLASLIPPLTASATAGVRLTLVLMHLAVAAVLVPGLRATTREPADPALARRSS
jgi:uncharacterized protein DUF6069